MPQLHRVEMRRRGTQPLDPEFVRHGGTGLEPQITAAAVAEAEQGTQHRSGQIALLTKVAQTSSGTGTLGQRRPVAAQQQGQMAVPGHGQPQSNT